ncbi:MAG: hypothetical protein AAB664_00135 [Patescibacteria group bacterium]
MSATSLLSKTSHQAPPLCAIARFARSCAQRAAVPAVVVAARSASRQRTTAVMHRFATFRPSETSFRPNETLHNRGALCEIINALKILI